MTYGAIRVKFGLERIEPLLVVAMTHGGYQHRDEGADDNEE
jgi:hypothetical protein